MHLNWQNLAIMQYLGEPLDKIQKFISFQFELQWHNHLSLLNFQDPRFNKDVDLKTGYRTHSILCMPILNYEGEVIGVAQIINKVTGNHEFTKQDEDVRIVWKSTGTCFLHEVYPNKIILWVISSQENLPVMDDASEQLFVMSLCRCIKLY